MIINPPPPEGRQGPFPTQGNPDLSSPVLSSVEPCLANTCYFPGLERAKINERGVCVDRDG